MGYKQCKQCNKVFYHHESCGSERCCDNGFCSDKCMKESDVYKSMMKNAEEFYDSLSMTQRKRFNKLMDVYTDYEDEIDALIYEVDTFLNSKGK